MINQKRFRFVCFSAAIFLFGVVFFSMPSVSQAEVKTYYTYHFSGSRVITDGQLGVDFMEEYFPMWVYDGEREWNVGRFIFGFYTRYEYDGCVLYTNSLSIKATLNYLAIPRTSGYGCLELDAEDAPDSIEE